MKVLISACVVGHHLSHRSNTHTEHNSFQSILRLTHQSPGRLRGRWRERTRERDRQNERVKT